MTVAPAAAASWPEKTCQLVLARLIPITYLNCNGTNTTSPLDQNPSTLTNRLLRREKKRMTSRAPSSKQRTRLFEAQMLGNVDQSLITNDHILCQCPRHHACPKDAREVIVSLVSATEPGVGMQDHSIPCFPNGLCANFFYDACGVAAGD